MKEITPTLQYASSPTLENGNGIPLSTQAASYFVRASKDYPASSIAQAAEIALLCRREGANPEELKNALNNDKVKIKAIKKTAQNYHMIHGIDVKISEFDIRIQVINKFLQAKTLMVLEDTQLIHITDSMYPYCFRSGNYVGIDEGENAMKETISEMLREKAKSL